MSEDYNIPKHWQVKKLIEVCNKIGDIDHKMPKQLSSGYPYVSTKDFTDNLKISFDNAKYISEEDYLNLARKIKPERGDIIFPRYGTIGKNILVDFDKEFLVSYSCAVVKPNQNLVLSKYVYLYTLSPKITEEIRKYTVETTQANVGIASIKNFIFPLPPLSEQQAIVSKIEELLSDLENGKEQLQLAQQQLKIYKQSLLKWAFEGKLTNKNEKDGELPKGWKEVLIKEVTEMNPKIPDRENISKQMEVQFLPMKLVEEIVNKIHLTEIRKYEDVLKGSYTPFINGDVIFAKVTPCMENGKIAIVDSLKNGIGFGSSEFHVIRAGDKVISKFIFYYLVQDRFRNEAAKEMTGAVGLRRVPKQFIENYSIPLPTLAEQQLIVDELESKLTVCDKIEETISQSLLQAESLRQSILKKAFEGKL